MARNKEYELMVKIAGAVDPSLRRSVGTASGQMGKLQGVVKKFAKYASIGYVTKEVVKFGAECTKAAINFESSMADVSKVVDGLKDDAGNTTQAYNEMYQSILNLSTQIPMTADEISQIVASAGQANIASNELLSFAEAAAKMGIAFDTTAEQAGDWMAQWRTSMSLTQDEVVTLADQINYLGNTSSEKAGKLSEIVSSLGSLGQIAGLSGGQIAALGAATTGIDSNVAATGLKNMIVAMTAGSAATAKQQNVLKSLGFTAEGVAKAMQEDAQGAVMNLLSAINKLPAAEQAAAIKNYFGKESLTTVATLANNLGNLQAQFDKVGDSSQYAGSMQKEYEARAATTENSITLMKNAAEALKIQLGNELLPVVGKGAKLLAKVFTATSNGLRTGIPLVKQFFSSNMMPFLRGAGKLLSPLYTQGKNLFGSVRSFLIWASPALKSFAGFFGGKMVSIITSAVSKISGVLQGCMKVIGGLLDFVRGTFTGDWKLAWQGVRDIFGGVWKSFTSLAKTPLNAIIGMINKAIGGINSLGVTLPDWIPKIGGKHLGVTIPTIPYLASGGIVSAPTLAMIGEGREPEAVTPLSKLEAMFKNFRGGGEKIVYAPVFNVRGGSTDEISRVARMSFEEFKAFMERYRRENQRTKFAY